MKCKTDSLTFLTDHLASPRAYFFFSCPISPTSRSYSTVKPWDCFFIASACASALFLALNAASDFFLSSSHSFSRSCTLLLSECIVSTAVRSSSSCRRILSLHWLQVFWIVFAASFSFSPSCTAESMSPITFWMQDNASRMARLLAHSKRESFVLPIASISSTTFPTLTPRSAPGGGTLASSFLLWISDTIPNPIKSKSNALTHMVPPVVANPFRRAAATCFFTPFPGSIRTKSVAPCPARRSRSSNRSMWTCALASFLWCLHVKFDVGTR
mmetsp:Transcript_10412/g.63590  ORF Transcript_10412/g.63590 Transcript_10412/m.63590 type:complete len:271 (+) Transcript_10412:715-1527(+)